MLLSFLSGCQAAADKVETKLLPSMEKVEQVSVAPTSTATTEPVSITQTTPMPTAEPVSVSQTPTSTAQLSATALAAEIAPAQDKEGKDYVTITIVYDNNSYDPRLQTAWGFGCLVETSETTILFDTGGDGTMLLGNMETLGIEPGNIEIVVLSHFHGDHTGGLESLLATGVRPIVYVPHSFPFNFKSRVQAYAELVEVQEATKIANGIYSTGEMGTGIVEQALILTTSRGLIVVTGCAHPGISEMVERAKEISQEEIYLVLGGFHLGGASEVRIKEIISDFQRLGVQKVAPCHCTGDKAIALLREAYGEDLIENGAGQMMEIPP